MYSFTEKAKQRPIRRILFGRWVAIGAEQITIEREAPQLNEVIKMPTQKEMEILYDKPQFKSIIVKENNPETKNEQSTNIKQSNTNKGSHSPKL